MPPPPSTLYSGLAVLSAVALVALLASVLTLLVSWALLRLYHRAVKRLMFAPAAAEPTPVSAATVVTASRAPGEPALNWAAQNRSVQDLIDGALGGPWRYARRYAIAGVLYALVLAPAGYYAFAQTQINPLAAASHPLQMLFFFWTFVWPGLLTFYCIAGAGRMRYGIVAGYFLVLVMIGALTAWVTTETALPVGDATLPGWSGETPMRLLAKWCLYNLTPTLLTLAFRSRRVRAVAPLVLSFVTVIVLGLIAVWFGVFYYQQTSLGVILFAAETFALSVRAAVIGFFVVAGVLALMFFTAIGWWLLAWMRTSYQEKSVSDQSLALDALWLLFAALHTALLAPAGLGWALLALAAYALFKVVLSRGRMLTLAPIKLKPGGPTLLILRVFALGKRSEVLFDAVSSQWRYIGNVQLIAGPDLAIATVAPHRFLAFVSGKLSRLFINDAGAMESQLESLDFRPDDDGRFRINDFFCRADTWQQVLRRLVAGSDAVLMDLRSFSKENDGCIFEINELLKAVPVPRLLLVTDSSTDEKFLRQTLANSCAGLPADAANFGISGADMPTVQLSALKHRQLRDLLKRLCMAAESSTRPAMSAELVHRAGSGSAPASF